METFSLDIQDIGITDDEVNRLLDELDDGQDHPSVEQRQSRRDTRRGRATLIVLQSALPPAEAHWVRLRNISEHGVAFLKHGPLPLDAYVRLELPTGRDGRTVGKEAIVRHCRLLEGTTHEIGVEFLPDPKRA